MNVTWIQVGLSSFVDNFHWFYIPNLANTITPTTFKIIKEEDINNFIEQFSLTACVSLLKIVVGEVGNAESDSFFRNGKVYFLHYNYVVNINFL